MKLITDLKQNCLEPASVALGCFDGIHLGHQAVIGPAVADKMNGLTPSVFTFQENPLQVLTGNTVPTLLAPETRNQPQSLRLNGLRMPVKAPIMSSITAASTQRISPKLNDEI